MAGEDGRVTIKTALDDTDLKKGLAGLSGTLSAGMGGVLKGAEAVTKAVGGIALAVGGAAATLSVKLGKDVVAMFGELQQNLGGADAVFGQYAEAIKAYGEDAYKNLGASQSDYLATANKMGALFQGSGIEQQKSLDLTVQAMQRAADMASVMGIDVQVALDSVAGAAKGNFTMMDNLGVAMNATTIEAYALSKGLDFTWASATNAEKAELAMQMFFENTSQYAGNFAKESEQTVSGSIGLFKAASESFIAGLGNADADMAKLTANMIDAFDSVIVNVTPILENLVGAVPQALGSIMDAIVTMAPSLVDTASGLFDQVLAVVVDSLPGLVVLGSDLVQSLIGGLLQNTDQLSDAAVEIILALVDLITSNLPELAIAAIKIVLAVGKGIVDALPQLASSVKAMNKELITKFSEALPDFIEAGKNIVAGLAQGIKEFATVPIEAIKETGGKILGGIKSFFGIQSPSKVMMTIGEFLALGLAQGIKQKDGTTISAAEAQAAGIKDVFVALGEYGTVLGAAVTDELAQGIIDGQDGAVDASLDTVDKIGEAFKGLGDTIKNATSRAFTSFLKGMEDVGEAIAQGEDAWGALGKSALVAIASIVESLGHELAARAVTAALSFNWVGAGLATAGAAAAYIASGMIKSWANSFAVGGIVPAQSGVSTTGDQTVIYANPGELILNAAQQTNVARQLEALAKINELVGPSSGGSLSIGIAFNGPVFGDQEAISRYVYDGIKRAQWEGVLKQW